MGSEGEFAVAVQRALQDIFRSHEEVVLGLQRKNRLLLLEVRKLKAGVKALTEQLEQLYRENQLLASDKMLLESLRRKEKNK